MSKRRDYRTAYEKWEEGMAQARRKGLGYWQVPPALLPPGLCDGWDHTKHSSQHIKTYESQGPLASRGNVPVGVRDDTEDELRIVVTTYGPFFACPQNTKTRVRVIKTPPKAKQSLSQLSSPALLRLPKKNKEVDGMMTEEEFQEIGGLRWLEWCAWDDNYVASRVDHITRLFSSSANGRIGDYNFLRNTGTSTLMAQEYFESIRTMARLATEQGTFSFETTTRECGWTSILSRLHNFLCCRRQLITKPWISPTSAYHGRQIDYISPIPDKLGSEMYELLSHLAYCLDHYYSVTPPGWLLYSAFCAKHPNRVDFNNARPNAFHKVKNLGGQMGLSRDGEVRLKKVL